MAYRVIDKETYYRKDVFRRFSEDCKCSLSMTARIDVTDLVAWSKRTGTRFYLNFLYLLSRVMNAREDYRMDYFYRTGELVADVDGLIVGQAGIRALGRADKVKHRATFGISIDIDWWHLGIGRALTKACIELAKQAGYLQLELEAVAANERALALYESEGFREYGRNPKGFRSRLTGWQELVLMRREL